MSDKSHYVSTQTASSSPRFEKVLLKHHLKLKIIEKKIVRMSLMSSSLLGFRLKEVASFYCIEFIETVHLCPAPG